MGTAVRPLTEVEILLQDLLLAASENRVTVADSLEKTLSSQINFGEEAEACLALEITSRLGWPLGNIARGVQGEVFDTWEQLANRVFENCSNRIAVLSSRHFSVCCEAVWRGKIHLNDLVKWHGFKSLFQSTYFILFPNEYYRSLAHEIIYVELVELVVPPQNCAERPRKFAGWINALKEIAHVSLVYTPPWIKGPSRNSVEVR